MYMLTLSVFLSAIFAANAGVVNWPENKCPRRVLYTKGTLSDQMKAYIKQLTDPKAIKANDELLKVLAPLGGDNAIGCPNSPKKPGVKDLIGAFNYAELTNADVTKSCTVGQKKTSGRYYARLMDATDYFKVKNDVTFECEDKPTPAKCNLKSTAPSYIGYRPLVFGSIPEGYIGKHVVEMMWDVGYDAAGMFDPDKLNKPKVLVVWRYEDDVIEYLTKDEKLVDDLTKAIYRPTWENLLAAFDKFLANAKADKLDQNAAIARDVTYLHFETDADLNNARAWIKEKAVTDYIKKTSYKDLKAKGASAAEGSLEKKAWKLRSYLEPCFAAYKLFTGKGKAENEVWSGVITGTGVANNRADGSGIPEWMLPNRDITKLAEVAIIYVGTPTGDDAVAIANQLKPDILNEMLEGKPMTVTKNATPPTCQPHP